MNAITMEQAFPEMDPRSIIHIGTSWSFRLHALFDGDDHLCSRHVTRLTLDVV